MRIKFLVLIAVLCLTVVSAHKSSEDKDRKYGKQSSRDIKSIKHIKEVEENKERSKKVEIKKEIVKEARRIPCIERIQKFKDSCERNAPKGYKGIFKYQENDDCDWECNYEGIPIPGGEQKPPIKKTVVVKKQREPRERPERKECSGEKKIMFSNCMVKVRGLIAFGDKTKNFDKKFEKLLRKKKKRALKGGRRRKGAKGGRRAGPRKPRKD